MEKYAIIKLGGKQFLVKEGTQFKIERQADLKPETLFFSDGKAILVGQPILTDVSVKMEFIEKDTEDKKIRVARFRNKSRHRRVKGHSQPISIVKVKEISHGEKSTKKEEKPAGEKKTAKKPTSTKKVASSRKKAA